MKNIIFPIALLMFLSSQCTWASGGGHSSASPYEKSYIAASSLIQSLVPNNLTIYGMTLNGKTMNINIRVENNQSLSDFMKALSQHPKFESPKLVAHSEFHKPGFALLEVKLLK